MQRDTYHPILAITRCQECHADQHTVPRHTIHINIIDSFDLIWLYTQMNMLHKAFAMCIVTMNHVAAGSFCLFRIQ